MNRRPVGVIVCAILLGLAGLFSLVMAFFAGLAAVIAPAAAAAATQPGQPQLPPGAFVAITIVSVLLYLGFAGWSGSTVVGLLKTRNWARISAIVIGAAFVFLGFSGVLGIFAAQATLPTMQLPPNTDPRLLHTVFGVMGFFALCAAGFGVWCIVYFSLRRTKEAFRALTSPRTLAEQSWQSPNNWQAAEPTAYDNSYARQQAREQQNTFGLTATINGRRRPVSITVIAILLLIGSFSCLLQMLSSAPIFLCGFVLSGWPAHIAMLVFCAVNGVSGFGLLKLEKPAWALACGVYCVPILNALAMLFPGARRHFNETVQAAMAHSSLGNGQALFSANMTAALAIVSTFVGLAFSGVMLALLWRAKWSFDPEHNPQAAE